MIPKEMSIVGSSSSILESKKGEAIDKQPYVARFNNAIVNKLYEKCIGKRWNVWVTSFYTDIVDPRKKFDYVFCPLPLNNIKWNKRYRRNEHLIKRYNPIFIPTTLFEQLLEYNANPSTGLAFLYWFYRTHGELMADNLHGFSWFRGRPHYYDGKTYTTHDGEEEENIFFSMLWGELDNDDDPFSIIGPQSTDTGTTKVPEEKPQSSVAKKKTTSSRVSRTQSKTSDDVDVSVPVQGKSVLDRKGNKSRSKKPKSTKKRKTTRKKKSSGNKN